MSGASRTRRYLLVATAVTVALCGVSGTASAQGAPPSCDTSRPAAVFMPVTGPLGDILVDDACDGSSLAYRSSAGWISCT